MNKAHVKPGGGGFAFWITFLAAFLALTALLTPVLSAVLESRPLLSGTIGDDSEELDGTELVVLEQDFDWFLPSGSPFYEAFKSQKRMNCLLLGVKSGLTDTIMLVSLNVDTQMVDVISVPRDTYYHRKGYNGDAEDKINAAYRKNPLNSAKAVSDVLLGMPINYYVVIEDKGVENVIDFIGGVPMNIEFHMQYDDPRDKPPLHIDIPAGQQVLDGKKSVQFLRYRHGYREGDLGRVKAQQEFVKSAFRQALKSDLSQLAKKIQENVVSDLPINTFLYLVQKSIGMSGDNIRTHTMPGKPMSAAPWYVYPDTKEIEALIKEIYELAPENATGAAVSGPGASVGASG